MIYRRLHSEPKYEQRNTMATFEYLGMSLLPKKDVKKKMNNEQVVNVVPKRNRSFDDRHNVMYVQEFPKGKNRIVILNELSMNSNNNINANNEDC